MNPVQQSPPHPADERAVAAGPTDRADLSKRVQSLRLPGSSTAAPSSGRAAWFLCALLAASTAVLAWLLWNRPPTEAAAPLPAASSAGGPVTAGQAKSSGGIALDAKGYIIPIQQVLISPEASGKIVELNIEEGMQVQQGALLAVIERDQYVADKLRADAMLDAAPPPGRARERFSARRKGSSARGTGGGSRATCAT